MTENKLYAQCREEAYKQFEQRFKDAQTITGKNGVLEIEDEWNQLTAEIYGMKLLDMSQPDNSIMWFAKGGDNNWRSAVGDIVIGTTQDLHDHFVREFNKWDK